MTNNGVPLSHLKQTLVAAYKGQAGTVGEQALQSFELKGFPAAKNEEWKYTPVSKFLDESWTAANPAQAPDLTDIIARHSIEGLEAHLLVFYNGAYDLEHSRIIPGDTQGLTVLPIADAIANNEYFGKALAADTNGFVAINTALAQNGIFLKLNKNSAPVHPFHLIFISGDAGEQTMVQTRNLVVLEEGARINVIETYASTGTQQYLNNFVTEIFAGERAELNQYRLQVENDNNARQVNFTQVVQQKGSLVNNLTLTTGGKLVRNDLQYRLENSDCESHMFGLYIGSGSQHIDNHTLMDHAMPHCFSNEFYKGIMADKSTGVFNGKVIVQQDAQKTNAYQSNKNILLSDDAHINTKPQLEIFANDVKCSHGATTGQLDEEALFYLRSRGIGQQEAKAMLTSAFAADVLENIKIEALKAHAGKIVMEKLESLTGSN